MHVHHLHREQHQEFLAESRQDPITGDVIQAGDRVVFCASCKSAFLVDSWNYIGKKHCNQSRTLPQIPSQKLITIYKNAVQVGHFKVKGLTKGKRFSDFMRNVFPLFAIMPIYLANMEILDFVYLFLGIMFGIPTLFYSSLYLSPYKEKLTFRGNRFVIEEGKKNEIELSTSEIESVEVYTPPIYKFNNWSYRNSWSRKDKEKQNYALKITTKSGDEFKFLLRKKELEKLKEDTLLLERFTTPALPESTS